VNACVNSLDYTLINTDESGILDCDRAVHCQGTGLEDGAEQLGE